MLATWTTEHQLHVPVWISRFCAQILTLAVPYHLETISCKFLGFWSEVWTATYDALMSRSFFSCSSFCKLSQLTFSSMFWKETVANGKFLLDPRKWKYFAQISSTCVTACVTRTRLLIWNDAWTGIGNPEVVNIFQIFSRAKRLITHGCSFYHFLSMERTRENWFVTYLVRANLLARAFWLDIFRIAYGRPVSLHPAFPPQVLEDPDFVVMLLHSV